MRPSVRIAMRANFILSPRSRPLAAGISRRAGSIFPVVGDIVIIQGIPGHEDRHRAMFNGRIGVADSSSYTASTRPRVQGKEAEFALYRSLKQNN